MTNSTIGWEGILSWDRGSLPWKAIHVGEGCPGPTRAPKPHTNSWGGVGCQVQLNAPNHLQRGGGCYCEHVASDNRHLWHARYGNASLPEAV